MKRYQLLILCALLAFCKGPQKPPQIDGMAQLLDEGSILQSDSGVEPDSQAPLNDQGQAQDSQEDLPQPATDLVEDATNDIKGDLALDAQGELDTPQHLDIDEVLDSHETVDSLPTPDLPSCAPKCNGKQCGPDGCGESCGTCDVADFCTVGGQCIAPPQIEILAQGQSQPMGIAIGNDYVYWANKGDGRLMRAALTGTQAPEELFNAGYNPWALAVDETRLYWTDILEGTVRYMVKTGGPAQVISGSTSVHRGISLSGTHAYWTSDMGAIWSSTKVNPTPSPLLPGQDQPEDIRYTDNMIFWTDRAQGSVNSLNLSSNEKVSLAVLQEWPMGIAVDETHVYWTTMDTDSVRRVPTTGGEIQELASEQADPFRLTLDEFFVYWTNRQNGQVLRIAKEGGVPSIVAQGLGKPGFITSTATYLYWTNSEDGTVTRIQK